MKTKIMRNIKRSYTNGKLIKEEEFQLLDDLIQKAVDISNKEDYIKKDINVDKYLKMDIDEFELLAKQHSSCLSLIINLEDIFGCVLNGETDVFPSMEEAKKELTNTLTKLAELKKEYNNYFNEEL